MNLSAPQNVFLNGLNNKYNAYVGGFGSGKTFVGCLDLLIFLGRYPGTRQGYFSISYPAIRDVFYPTFEEAAELMGFSTVTRVGDREVDVYRNGRYYGTVICRSMDNPGSIIGFKIARAMVDEIDVLPTDKANHAWNKIIARMRLKIDGVVNGINVTTTPEGFKFVYSKFAENPTDRYSMVQASTYENEAFLPDDYIPSLMESYPSELIKAYLNGEFVNLTSGTVYHTFDRVKHNSSETIKHGEPLFIGLDFNVQNMSAVTHIKREGDPIAVDELIGLYDTPAMIEAIKDRYPKHKIYVYPDASGNARKTVDASVSDISLLKGAGFYVMVNKKNPNVRDRITCVNACFEKRNYKVNVSKCPIYTRSLEQQSYGKDGKPDKTQGDDHACFDGDQVVHTLNGDFKFKDLPAKGYVLGPDGRYTRYINAGVTGHNKTTCRIDLSCGQSILSTTDHTFLTGCGEWVQAVNLNGKKCVLLATQYKNLKVSDFTNVENTFQTNNTGGKGGYTGLCGLNITGVLNKAFISIISTITNITTVLKTSLALMGANTPSTMLLTGARLEHYPSTQREVGLTQKLGISPKKDEHGTKSIMKKQNTSLARNMSKNATTATLNMVLKFRLGIQKTISALKTANQRTDENPALTMRGEIAKSVAQNLRSTNIQKCVDVVGVEVLSEQERVYCLTVPNYGCFKLNKDSPIVSNCDAAGYFITLEYPIVRPVTKLMARSF